MLGVTTGRQLLTTTDNTTVGGVINFSQSPTVPSPSVNEQVANKLYVDTISNSLSSRIDSITSGVVGGGLFNISHSGSTFADIRSLSRNVWNWKGIPECMVEF